MGALMVHDVTDTAAYCIQEAPELPFTPGGIWYLIPFLTCPAAFTVEGNVGTGGVS